MAGGRINDKWKEYGCNENDVAMLAVATRDSSEEILYGYSRNGCDSVLFGLITQEGGSEEIGTLMNMGGKAGPTFLIHPDRTISDELYYSTYAIDKCFQDVGVTKADCRTSIAAPIVGIVSPKNREEVPTDALYQIEWRISSNRNIAHIKIFFRENDTESWSFLDSLSGEQRSYNWAPPLVQSKSCRLRIEVSDIDGNTTNKQSTYFGVSAPIKTALETEKFGIEYSLSGRELSLINSSESVCLLQTLNGRVIWRKKAEGGSRTLFLPQTIPPGIYTLSIENGQNTFQKIVTVK